MALTFVLDTSAVMRYIDTEAGYDRVRELFNLRESGDADLRICANHWSEVLYVLLRRTKFASSKTVLSLIESLSLDIIPVTAERALGAAQIRYKYGIAFADSFGVELISASPDYILVTADFDFKPAATDFRIEFLPAKPKP